ncbi:MAG TPA: hypothetical protein DDY72_06720 [Verrucomicrobia bacterium]|nr:hypothetical protein [Verrucomicrobiota bacterium]
MNLSRRSFLGGLGAGAALVAMPGCCTAACRAARPGKVALQLYSIRGYIEKNGLAKALADIRAIGYEGVEFAGYWGFKAPELKKMLDDNGLVACGTHVGKEAFSPENFKATCEFNLAYGNSFICCPGGGNMPTGVTWSNQRNTKPSKEIDDFTKKLCDYYNKAAADCATMGCRIGLHNHEWEHFVKMTDGVSFWDYFFSHTDKAVLMEQDVGWTTCAGVDPCVQYKKYPGRSFTLHAKENGMGSAKFDAILGQPGEGAKGVEWDRLFKVTDADNVQWYVVECERHDDSLFAVKPSFEFLKSKGRV